MYQPHARRSGKPRAWRIGAIAAAIAIVGGALGVSSTAVANEFGSTLQQVNATTWTATAPSGLQATVAAQALMSTADAPTRVAQTGAADLSWGPQQPPVPGGTNGVRVGIGSSGGVMSYPIQWSHDQQWHPAARATITFDHPVVNPTVAVGTFNLGASHSVDGTKTGAGTANMQMRFTGAQGPAGAVPVTVSAKPGFNTGLYSVASNTVTPNLVGGQIPYLSSFGLYCDPASPETTDSLFSPYLNDAFGEIYFVGGPCGSLQIDTGGQPITQLTIDQDLTFAASASELPNQTWNGYTNASMVLNFSTLTEVSGSQTPASLGAATHAVGSLAIGTENVPAFTTVNLTTATAGTATDNSDAGYVPEDQLVHAQLTNRSTGSFTVTVPYSGLTQDGFLNGWIDFNNDGVWDPGESADTITPITHTSGSQSGTAVLTFTVPADPLPVTSDLPVRLRIAYDSADVASPTGMARSGEVEDHFFTVLDAVPDLLITKSHTVDDGGPAVVGSTIAYQLSVTNQSTTAPATDVTVTDVLPAGLEFDAADPRNTAGLSYDAGTRTLSFGPTTIAASGTLTIDYVVTATALGDQANTATADSPTGCQTTGAADVCSADDTITIEPTGSLTLVKTTPDLPDSADFTLGQVVTYQLTVRNDSDVIIDNIAIDDPLIADQSCVLPVTTLGPGESTFCQLTYTVTQADIDARQVVNTATATGEFPDGTAVPPATADKQNDTFAEAGTLTITKTSALASGGTQAQLGDVIDYDITAQNTSGFTMSDVTLTDDLLGGAGMPDAQCTLGTGPGAPTVTFPYDGLAPGATIHCTGSYTVMAADVTAGHVLNEVTGAANLPPDPADPTTPIPADVVPDATDDPVGGLVTVKQAFLGGTEIDPGQQVALGDVISYRITVTNTAAFQIDFLAIDDPVLRDARVSLTCDPGLPISLGHGESIVCSGDYPVTQADIDRGHIANVATATGTWTPDIPGGPSGPVDPSSDSTDTPTIYPTGGTLELAKTSTIHDAATGAQKQSAAAGDRIDYVVTAHNTTGLTMSAVTLTDNLLPGMGTAASPCSIDTPAATGVVFPATLAPDATLTCAISYTVTADDAAAGKVLNVVTGSGQVPGQFDPDNPDVTPPPVPITPEPASNTQPVGGLEVTKAATPPRTPAQLGDRISYVITVTNTSAFPMDNVTVSDTLITAGNLTCDPGNGVTLGAKDSIRCTGEYTVTQADINAGRVLNTATATGTWADPPEDWAGPQFPTGAVTPATASASVAVEGHVVPVEGGGTGGGLPFSGTLALALGLIAAAVLGTGAAILASARRRRRA